jgi:hypothetical protein
MRWPLAAQPRAAASPSPSVCWSSAPPAMYGKFSSPVTDVGRRMYDVTVSTEPGRTLSRKGQLRWGAVHRLAASAIATGYDVTVPRRCASSSPEDWSR